VINDAIQRQRTKTKHTALLQTTEQLRLWKIEEEQVFQQQAEIIRDSGASVVIATGNIHSIVLHYLQTFGILCIADYSDINQLQTLCKMSGCTMVHNLDELTSQQVGYIRSVEIVNLAQRDYSKIVVEPHKKCCSIALRGSTMEQCDEYVRHCQDALQTIHSMSKREGQGNKFLPGGGAFELEAMVALRDYADQNQTQDKVAIKCFADAFEIIPRTLCENAALHVESTMVELIQKHKEGMVGIGIPSCHYLSANDDSDKIEFDMLKNKVLDSFITKQAVLKTATSIACTILRSKFVLDQSLMMLVSDNLPAKPRQ
jgi:chaperonin GroEL (HSP60 family)